MLWEEGETKQELLMASQPTQNRPSLLRYVKKPTFLEQGFCIVIVIMFVRGTMLEEQRDKKPFLQVEEEAEIGGREIHVFLSFFFLSFFFSPFLFLLLSLSPFPSFSFPSFPFLVSSLSSSSLSV
jgi:hypothetical protein